MGRVSSKLFYLFAGTVDREAERHLLDAAALRKSPASFGEPRAPGNGSAIAAFAIGIISVVLGLVPLVFFWISLPLGVAAVVTGVRGSNRGLEGAPHRELAVAGLVLGVIGCALPLLWMLVLL